MTDHIKTNTLVFFDTETTGKDLGRLIQLCFWNPVSGPTPVVEFFKPPIAIEIEAMAVHHITEKMLENTTPMTEDYREYLQEIFARNIMVAHNAKFDIGVMEREGIKTDRFICTYKVVQALYDLPQYKLQYLRYLWGIEIKATAHDAQGDVFVLERVFEKMIDDERAKGLSREETIEKFIKISGQPSLVRRMAFGKWAGKTFEEIHRISPEYLQWIVKQETFDPDIVHTAKHWLSGGQKSLL